MTGFTVRSLSLWTSLCTGIAAAALLAACAGTKASSADTTPVAAPDLSEAEQADRRALEEVFHSFFDVPPLAKIPDRLVNPQSIADAQDVVRSDNIALYPMADKVFTAYLADHPDDLENLTWHAQLFLAWADSASLTQQALLQSVAKMEEQRASLEAQAANEGFSDADRDRAADKLEEMIWLFPLAQSVAADLEQLAREKLAVGAEKSLAILKNNPDTYEGYRLAADLFRLTGDWEQHGQFLVKLEARNPDSRGLLFLRGVKALQRDRDHHAAETYLRQTLAKDPKFAKAQYYLALTYLNMRRFDHAKEALERTLEISPGHPFANAMMGYVARVKDL